MCVGGCGSVYLLSLSISENDRQDLSIYLRIYPIVVLRFRVRRVLLVVGVSCVSRQTDWYSARRASGAVTGAVARLRL
jgi:hypothetical protein